MSTKQQTTKDASTTNNLLDGTRKKKIYIGEDTCSICIDI